MRDESQLKQTKFGIKCCQRRIDGHNKATYKMPMSLIQEASHPNTTQLAQDDFAPTRLTFIFEKTRLFLFLGKIIFFILKKKRLF